MKTTKNHFGKVTAIAIAFILIAGFVQGMFGINASAQTNETLGSTVEVYDGLCAYITSSSGKTLTGDSNKKVYSAQKSYAFNASQAWCIRRIGNKCYSIQNLATGKYLDVSGSGTDEGTAVCMWKKNDNFTSNQRWRFYDAGNGRYNLKR